MLTIHPLKGRSIAYYNDTSRAAMKAAADRQRAGGGQNKYSPSVARRGQPFQVKRPRVMPARDPESPRPWQ